MQLCLHRSLDPHYISQQAPIKNTYGQIETPETSGVIRTETAVD